MDKIYKIYELFPDIDTSKHYLLEPFSTIIKLILLKFKPPGTKINIYNNSIQYNYPSLFQGISRSLSGDSRQDLHNLCNPIMKSLEWYPITEYSFFYNLCIDGMNKLKESYDSNSIINHTLDHYIGLLEGKQFNSIKENAVVSKLKTFWCDKEISIIRSLLEHILSIESNKEKENYIQQLESMIVSKENTVYNYIHEISTGY